MKNRIPEKSVATQDARDKFAAMRTAVDGGTVRTSGRKWWYKIPERTDLDYKAESEQKLEK